MGDNRCSSPGNVPMVIDSSELEESAALLVGHTITRVRYLGWWKEAPEEPEAYVEYVEVTMEDGAVLRISTDADDNGTHAISLYEGPYPAPTEGILALDASGRGGWKSLLGLAVTASSIGWAEVGVARVRVRESPERVSEKPVVSVGMERVVVPCELNLQFQDGGSVILTAAAWSSDGTLVTDSDNVAVVFGEADAERLGIGRWRSGRVAQAPRGGRTGDDS